MRYNRPRAVKFVAAHLRALITVVCPRPTMITAHVLMMKSRIVLVAGMLLALASAGSPTAQQASTGTRPPAETRPPVDIVIQGAVDLELQPLLAALTDKETMQLAAWTFWRGQLGGKRVVVSRTDVGPINASVATTLAVVHFRPRLIINQGTAGALDPSLNVFDIVAGEATVDYGAFRSAPAAAGAGVSQSRWTPMSHWLRLDGKERVEFKRFAGDADALATTLGTPNPRGRVLKGVIGSAFEFNREIDRLVWANRTYGAVSEDMESAFAAGAATGLGVRFIAVRIISDSEFRSPEFQRIAGEYCAAFVVEVVKRLRP
jgi:adenosylhomocysteine nucleosidase